MTNRREFLQIGMAAGAWPLASKAAFAVPAGAPAPVPLYKVVYDARFPVSVAFGARARELGLSVHEIEGDITAFWYEELDAVWRPGPAGATLPPRPQAIAGLTAHGPLFCLERLAWDSRLRAVFKAEHVAAARGMLEHRLYGPLPMLRQGLRLAEAGEAWPRAAAEIAARCPQGKAEIANARVTGAGELGAGADGEPLYTWVIAPAVQAADRGETT
jgi:hypothetical protein